MTDPAKVTTLFEQEDLERVRKVARSEGLKPSVYLRMLALRDLRAREQQHPVAA